MSTEPQTEILFVDDEEGLRLTLAMVLRSFGFSVTTAATVPEALSLIASRKFDVLIADLNIGQPGDGFTVVSAMRRTQPQVVTFILTGYPAFETALEAIRQQVDDYLIKPTETEALVEKIKLKLAKRGRRPAEHLAAKRVHDVVIENRDSVINEWLRAVKEDPQLTSVSLPDQERINHLPRLLEQAAATIDEQKKNAEITDRAAIVHGATRFRQGYTIPMMVKEAALLQQVVGKCVQGSLLILEVSYIISDMVNLSQMIMDELGASVAAFLEQQSRFEALGGKKHKKQAKKPAKGKRKRDV